jgi:tripartite-type tricarboxylate transporter receptor subunit TctC
MQRLFQSIAVVTVTVFAVAAGSAAAQSDYPNRPAKLVSPFSAGGTNDYLSRAIAQKLTASLGQPFTVDNRAGANGILGADVVAKSPADGYTLLMGNGATHGVNTTLYSNLPYDAIKDFTPVGMVGSVPIVLISSVTMPFKTLPELIAYSRANPGKLSFGTSGQGGTAHIAGEKFKQATGVDAVHVPYKGDSPALTDVLAGQIPLSFISITSVLPHLKSGRMRVLAVANTKRASMIPDVPTFAEAGVKDVEFSTWFAVMAPAGTPKEVVAKLNREIVKAVLSPELKERFATQGAEPAASTPEELDAFIRSEIEKLGKIIKQLGIKQQ